MKDGSPSKTLVLDVGGVLVGHSSGPSAVAEYLHVPAEELEDHYERHGRRLDLGEITTEEYFADLTGRDGAEMVEMALRATKPTAAVDRIPCWAQVANIDILSNWGTSFPRVLEILAIDPHVRTYYVSSETKAVKPHADAFVPLVEMMCRGEEVLFVDDRVDNLHAAEQHGIPTCLADSGCRWIVEVDCWLGFSEAPHFYLWKQ